MPDLDARIKAAAARPGHELDLDQVRSGAIARRRRGRVMVAGAAIVALVLVVGAARLFSGSTEESQELNVVNVSDLEVADPLEGVAADSWVRTLALVPNTPSVRSSTISMVDLERMRAEAGVEAPPAGAGDGEVADYVESLFGADAQEMMLPLSLLSSELEREWGVSYGQIDQIVASGMPPGDFYVVAGRFDPTVVDTAVRSFPFWADRLEVAGYEGVDYFSWGEDYSGISSNPDSKITPLRPLGRGGRLAVDDEWMSWTLGDSETEATIEARLDPTTSMAVIGWARRAALMADDLGLTSLVLWSPDIWRSSAPEDRVVVDAPAGFAYGAGATTGGWNEGVSLAYPSSEEAAANLDGVREAVEMVLDPGAFEAGVDDTDIVVTVMGTDQRALQQVLFRHLGFQADSLERPALPDKPQTVTEVMADGRVTPEEYEVAFWTFVECAEATGAEFGISKQSDGLYRYSVSDPSGAPGAYKEADACYESLFGAIDIVMQLSVDQD